MEVAVSTTDCDTPETGAAPVGVQGIGWNGVGVGEALGAAVTRTKGRAEEAGATVPHPAKSNPARNIT